MSTILSLICLALVMFVPAGIAAPLRLATWNLQEPAASATNAATLKNDARIPDAAVALGRSNPDIIILQQVRDWQMCQQVVQALQPAAYSVQVCSSFRDARTGASGKQQIAILSKRKAYFSWSEPWRADGQPPLAGGFAFAAVRVGKQRIGVFVIQLEAGAAGDVANGQDSGVARARAACVQQWVRQVGSFKQWVTNRIDAAVVAGGLIESPIDGAASPHSADEILFAESLLRAPLENPIALPKPEAAPGGATNYILARLSLDAVSLTGVVLDRCPAVCDLDFELAAQPTVAVARDEVVPRKAPPADVGSVQAPVAETKPRPASVNPPVAQTEAQAPAAASPVLNPNIQTGQVVPFWRVSWWLAGVAASILILLLIIWNLARRRPAELPRAQTLIALGSEGGDRASVTNALVITPQSMTGSAAEGVPVRPVVHIESLRTTQSETEEWRRRALAAEEKAERTADAVRHGLMPQMRRWLKQKLVRKLISDRTELLETQHAAALKAMAVDERLSRIELQIKQQNTAYERRIEELMRELAAARDENRELIRAKIAQVKAEMEAARAKVMQQAND